MVTTRGLEEVQGAIAGISLLLLQLRSVAMCTVSSCVQSAMLHASETWLLTEPNLLCLQHNYRAMIRQICNIKPEDVSIVRSRELLVKYELEDLNLILRERGLHVERS